MSRYYYDPGKKKTERKDESSNKYFSCNGFVHLIHM